MYRYSCVHMYIQEQNISSSINVLHYARIHNGSFNFSFA
jgi:hypothetical protein